MAEPEHVIREKLAAVFARQDFYEACLRQDAGAMVTIFEAGKVTQGQLAALTGIAQSTLSNYKRGVNTAKFASTFEKLADGTDMPPRLRQARGVPRAGSGKSSAFQAPQLRSVMSRLAAMSRSRAPGSRAMHSSTRAWLVRKLQLVTRRTYFPEI